MSRMQWLNQVSSLMPVKSDRFGLEQNKILALGNGVLQNVSKLSVR